MSRVVVETLSRYATSLWQHRGDWLLATLLVGVAAGFLSLDAKRTAPRWARAAALALIATLAVYHAWQLRWLCDDAFISFRYAKNLVDGLGLVFNEGARVEGYTNFLWTVALAGFIGVGLDPGQVTTVLSLGSLAGCCWIAAKLVRRIAGDRRDSARRAIPIAALLLAFNYTAASFGTSGLETMFAAWMVLVALERAEAGALFASGLAGIAATLAHPDHAIFYVSLGLVLLLRGGLRGCFDSLRRLASRGASTRTREVLHSISRNLLGYATPFLLLYVPYFISRSIYYGDLVPNTYHAKSGSDAYIQQGLVYLGISSLHGGIWAALPFSLVGMLAYRHTVSSQFSAIALPLYLSYVAKLGGDFMLGRLLVPVLPFGFVMAELGLGAALSAARSRWRSVGFLGVPVLALVAVPATVVRPGEKYRHVADERSFYRLESFDPIRVASPFTRQASALQTTFEDASRGPVVGIGCVGIVGYETGLPTFDNWGLTEPTVAKMKIAERRRPGHEKRASLGQWLGGNVDFADLETFPEPYRRHTRLQVGGDRYYLVKYDTDLLEPLRKGGAIDVEPFERWTRRWERPTDEQRLVCDSWFMSDFYLMHNTRSRVERRAAPLLEVLDDVLPEGFVAWVAYGESPIQAGYRELSRWSFEAGVEPGWVITGQAFVDQPRAEAQPGQLAFFGHRGAFISSFHPGLGSAAIGALESPEFEIEADVVALRVAGGHDAGLSVSLVVDDREVESLSGCDAEVFYRWAWDTARYRGQIAKLLVDDRSAEQGGHLSIDEVVFWQRFESAHGTYER